MWSFWWQFPSLKTDAEVLCATEGMKEDNSNGVSFFWWLRGYGLDGVKLVVGGCESVPRGKRCMSTFTTMCSPQRPALNQSCDQDQGNPCPGEQESR